jgi:hypothetical protein
VAERPLALERLLIALDLSVDLWAVRWDQEVAHGVAGEELGEGSVVGVGPGVIAHQSFHLDPVRGEVGESALNEAGDGCGLLVAVELAVGVAGVVVNDRVHPFEANPQPQLSAGAVAVTRDRVARTAEANKPFGVDVKEVAGAGPLVAAALLAWLLRRPRDPGAP